MSDMQRILIVDDDKVMVQLLRLQLRQKGFDVYSAGDGVEAWNMILDASISPDVVILDVNMPRMNGIELLDKIKGSKQTDHIAVLMLTTENKIESLSKTLDTGIIDYIIKPATLDQIMSRLLKVHRKLRRGVHELEKKEILPASDSTPTNPLNDIVATEQAPDEAVLGIDAKQAVSVLLLVCFEANKHSLGNALNAAGYHVDAIVEKDQEALEKKAVTALEGGSHRVVVVDSAPEYIDGYALTKHIRAFEKAAKKNYAILGIGDETKGDDARQWLISGMNEYFQKPVAVKTIVNAIKMFVEKYTI